MIENFMGPDWWPSIVCDGCGRTCVLTIPRKGDIPPGRVVRQVVLVAGKHLCEICVKEQVEICFLR